MQERALDEPEVYPPRAEVAGLPKLLCPLHAMVLSLGCVCVCVRSVASICLTLATPWTVACQAPLSIGFSRQEYWSGLPCLPPGELPDPGMEPVSPVSPALAGRFFTAEPPGKPNLCDITAHSDILHATDFLRELNCTFTILTNQPLISLLETNF